MSMSCTTGQLCTATSAARQSPDTPDVALVRSIAAGDKHAMRILFARHNVRVFRFVLRLVGDNSAAEDLVSEVRRLASGPKISGRSRVTTWLLAIARNKALSALRRWSTEELDEAAAAIEDPEDNPEVTMPSAANFLNERNIAPEDADGARTASSSSVFPINVNGITRWTDRDGRRTSITTAIQEE